MTVNILLALNMHARSQAVETGRTQFLSNCVECHGADGKGTGPLVLLRHEFLRRDDFAITELQHGHRGRLLTSAPINRRRMVAIEFGM